MSIFFLQPTALDKRAVFFSGNALLLSFLAFFLTKRTKNVQWCSSFDAGTQEQSPNSPWEFCETESVFLFGLLVNSATQDVLRLGDVCLPFKSNQWKTDRNAFRLELVSRFFNILFSFAFWGRQEKRGFLRGLKEVWKTFRSLATLLQLQPRRPFCPTWIQRILYFPPFNLETPWLASVGDLFLL